MEKIIKNFKNHNMEIRFIENKAELFDYIDELLKSVKTVGWGDSLTLEELGVFDYIRKFDIEIFDKHLPNLSREEKRTIYLKNFSADLFITGSNAITEDGKIVNIDGNGSRVAPMIYGPKCVLIIVGKNKLVKNEDLAMKRTRQIAAPLDAKRLEKNTPCTKLGRCIDCNHKERICNSFVTIANQFDNNRIKILVIDENLGF